MNNYVGLIQMQNGYQVQVLPKIDLGENPDEGNGETKRVFLRMLRSMKDFPSNIIGVPGCEGLPLYGQCYYKTAMGITRWRVPYYDDDTIMELVEMWVPPKKRKRRFLFW